MRVLINEDIPINLWEDYIERNPHATPFHSPSFYRFFNSISNFSASAYAIADGDTLMALAVETSQGEKGPAGIFSKRQIVYGGILAEDNCPHALDLLLKKVDEYADKRIIYSEIRNLSEYSLLKEVFLSNGYNYVPYLNFRVDTRDMDLLKKRISSSRLRQIKKAQQQSVICKEAENEAEVSLFYDILNALYKKKLRKPIPPKDFFIKFYNARLGKYLLVWHERKIIGGIMCPVLTGKAVYEFYICGLDGEYSELFPSVMATWSALEFANRNKIPLFDFMGAGRPGEQYGVRDFKARFGGEMVEYGRFLKIRKPFLYNIGKSGLTLKKYLG